MSGINIPRIKALINEARFGMGENPFVRDS